MPYSNKYDYLIFLHETFDFTESFSLENSTFVAISTIILLYCFILLYTLYRAKKTNVDSEPDDNMKKIIQDYRRELNEMSQPNATSFISLSTEPHNINNMRGGEYMLKSNIQETELKTLPTIDEHTNQPKDDISMLSISQCNNTSVISTLQKSKSQEIKSADFVEIKQMEFENRDKVEKFETQGLVKKEEKQIMAPPTFTDRFDVIQNNLAKKEASPGLNKSLNIDYTVKTSEDLNVKRGLTGSATKSPKFEQKGSNFNSSASLRKKKRVRHNVNTKFKQLIKVSNPIYSTYLKESRFFPKHIRITLIYFEVVFCFFLTTLTVIREENARQKDFSNLIMASFLTSFLAWGVFLVFTMILTTDKQKLMSARNDEDFYSALLNFEKEYKYRTVFGYLLIHILTFMFYFQILAFCNVFGKTTVYLWLGVNTIVLISQHFLLDFVYYFLLSSIYVQAYDSRTFKQIYNFLRGFRVWIV